MKKLIIGSSIVVAIVVGICMFSPTAKYAIKGNITKIENAAQLANAIEILEAKNFEMQEKYCKLATGMQLTKTNINKMQNNANAILAKPQTDINVAKYTMYTNGVAQLTKAHDRMNSVSEKMKTNIIKHKSNIELLRAKLTYLESLKTVNSYMKDISLDSEFGSGITALVEDAITQEEAVSAALADMNAIQSEVNDL